jgi:MscS family membrane protein
VQALQLSIFAQSWMHRLLIALAFVTAIVLVGAIAEAFAQATRERLEREGQKSGAGVVGVVNRIVKALLACVALIGILQALGFNVTGLLAGLGIGGIALALAAQKTVENLIGGLMVMTDKPVKIGDFCQFGTRSGWVEDVGFRSTRIRTLDRSVVSIPNAEFSNIQIENLSDRDRIRFFTTINLRYETTADQLRATLVELRKLFIGHPKIAADPLRIRLVGFGASSLDVEIQSYVMTTDPNEFSAIREDLLLRIMDIVAAIGTGFAFPSQTVYMAKDGGPDADKTRASEERIRALRNDGRLPFPDFTKTETGELSDRLDYPPEGSSTALPPVTPS